MTPRLPNPRNDPGSCSDLHRDRAQNFPVLTSLRMALSSAWSATSFLSRVFSCSSSFRRLAWSSRRPPYSFRQRVVRLLRDPELTDDLSCYEALCQLDLRGPKLPDDLFCAVALPAHSTCSLLDPKQDPKIHAGSKSGGQVSFSDPEKRQAGVGCGDAYRQAH